MSPSLCVKKQIGPFAKGEAVVVPASRRPSIRSCQGSVRGFSANNVPADVRSNDASAVPSYCIANESGDAPN